MAFFTYILASKRNGALYTGSTDNIVRRALQHREKLLPGFTEKYGVALLVWYETHGTRHEAFVRERQIKEWRRVWKLKLIEKDNPDWVDLLDGLWSEVCLPTIRSSRRKSGPSCERGLSGPIEAGS